MPKPKGFNRIDIPAPEYVPLKEKHPYFFQYNKIAQIQKDTTYRAEPHWIIINYPTLNAKIQLTYKPIKGNLSKLDAHIADAFKLAAKHQVKAISQTEKLVSLKNGKKAVIIELEGEVPSHYQFYTTDTTKNYLRGAVYLNLATENDSLRPIVDYLKKDSRVLLETLKWN